MNAFLFENLIDLFTTIYRLCLRQFKYMGRRRLGANGEGSSSTKSSTLPPRVPPPVFGSRPFTSYEPDNGNTSLFFCIPTNNF